MALHLNKLESPSYKNSLCQVKIGPVVLRKKIHSEFQISLFCNYPPPPSERGMAHHLNKLESSTHKDLLHTRMFYANLVEIGTVVLKKIFNFLECIFGCFEKDRALHLNKLEFLSPKDDLCQVWLKLV